MARPSLPSLSCRLVLPLAVVCVSMLSEAPQALAKRKQTATPPAEQSAPAPSPQQPAQTPASPAAAASEAGKTEAQPPSNDASPPLQWSSAEVEAALKECVAMLAAIKAKVEPVPAMRSGACGAPAPVLLRAVGTSTSVEISPPPIVNCRVVAQLHAWVETTLQPTAAMHLKSPVVRLTTASGYACRNRIGSSTTRLSEHATANAIDISAITTADGRRIDVASGWGAIARTAPPQDTPAHKNADEIAGKAAIDVTPQPGPHKRTARSKQPPPSGLGGPRDKSGGQTEEKSKGPNSVPMAPATASQSSAEPAEQVFLHALHRGACGTFTTVLGPEANDAHKGHLHFDLATRRGRSYCQ